MGYGGGFITVVAEVAINRVAPMLSNSDPGYTLRKKIDSKLKYII